MKCVCVTIMGGLGNQLYQLAYADYLRRTHGYQCCIINEFGIKQADITGKDRTVRSLFTDLIEFFEFPYLSPSSGIKWSIYRKIQPRLTFFEEQDVAVFLENKSALPPLAHTPKLHIPLVYKVRGYFQSYKYASTEFFDKLRLFFERTVTLPPHLQTVAEYLTERSVAIHFRRGDFLKHPELYNIFGAEHYLKGLELLSQKQAIDKVYVFSDDFQAIEPELRILSEKYELYQVEGGSVYEDFYLLSRFKRYVLAGSTFSWWGAFCSTYGKDIDVVVPQHPLKIWTAEDSYFPPHWLVLKEGV